MDNKLLHPTVAEFRGSPVAALVGDSGKVKEAFMFLTVKNLFS